MEFYSYFVQYIRVERANYISALYICFFLPTHFSSMVRQLARVNDASAANKLINETRKCSMQKFMKSVQV